MDGILKMAQAIIVLCAVCNATIAGAQNYERYAPKNPLDPNLLNPREVPEVTEGEVKEQANEDDRILVERLDAVVIVDSADRIVRDESIDDLEGIHYRFDGTRSLVYCPGFQQIIQRYLGLPITLRNVNHMAAELNKFYRDNKLPIVDVQLPEQRITTGTLHLVVVESRIGEVKVKPGCYFSEDELTRWIACTQPGDQVYLPRIENDLLWLNQNPFRRVTVDFEKGIAPGTSDVIFSSNDVRPLRGYIGADNSGVNTLNYGRMFAGATYGNVFGRGGFLGYQYTADESFSLLNAHAVNYTAPLSRLYSFQAYGSYASVSPMVGTGLLQTGESWQYGANLVRHLVRNRYEQSNLSGGFEFKSTNNNLEFNGSNVSASNANLLQLRFSYDRLLRGESLDEYSFFRATTFIGPGGNRTGAHSAEAFRTIRSGTSPDYIYGNMTYERSMLVTDSVQLVGRFIGQAASERLLFSEMLGIGGYDSLRGFDQRSYNADDGWIANFELGPRSYRWDRCDDTHVLRAFAFIDMANGFIDSSTDTEISSQFAASTGFGARYQVSDRLTARMDYGVGFVNLRDTVNTNRFHFGVTWTPGPRPR